MGLLICLKNLRVHLGKIVGVGLLTCMAAMCSVFPESVPAQSAVPEYQVKATFLFQFTQFVDWPQRVLPAPPTPLVIGILGEDPFGSFLDDTVRDEKVNDHPLTIQRYQRLEDVKNCHLLFVSRPEASHIREIASTFKNRSILTVGDTDGFADGGGTIQFVTQENKVRLRINLSAARSSNLTISSKLLRLATVINPDAR